MTPQVDDICLRRRRKTTTWHVISVGLHCAVTAADYLQRRVVSGVQDCVPRAAVTSRRRWRHRIWRHTVSQSTSSQPSPASTCNVNYHSRCHGYRHPDYVNLTYHTDMCWLYKGKRYVQQPLSTYKPRHATCSVHSSAKKGLARPGWTTSRRGQDSPWKS